MDFKTHKIAITLTGLVFILTCLTIGAVIAKTILNKRIAKLQNKPVSTHNKKSLLVLCAGDGTTLGINTPEGNDYPNILETLTGLLYSETNIRVENIAKPGQNSAGALAELYKLVPELKPNIVILMTGKNNFWNYDGYKAPLNTNITMLKTPYKLVEKSWYAKLFRLVRQKIRQKHYTLSPSPVKTHANQKQTRHTAISKITDKKEKAAAYLDFARNFDESGLTSKALRYYHKSYQIHHSLDAILGIGLAHRRQQESFLAHNWIERAAKDYPNRPDHYVAMAQYYYLNYDFENALLWTDKTLEKFPKNYESNVMRGQCFRILQSPNKASDEFEKAIENYPEKSPAYAEYALVYADSQDYLKALELTITANEKDPENPELYARAGHLNTLCNNPEQAARWFEKGIKKFPNRYENYKGTGLILLKLQKYKSASEYLYKALVLRPSDRGTYGALLHCLKNLKDGKKQMARLKNNPELGLGKNYPPVQKEIIIGNWLSSDLQAAIKLCRANGALPVLVSYPEKTPANTFMQRIAAKNNTIYINTTTILNSSKRIPARKTPYKHNSTARINSQIAGKIVKKLSQKHYLPAQNAQL